MARVYVLDVHSDHGGLFPWTTHYNVVQKGVRQAYYDAGPHDSPVTFVLLHGNPTWSFLYRRYIERLSKKYRVVAVDHVGFGRSDKPRDPKYYTIVQHISNLEKTLEHAGVTNAVLVVHDWGGPIGMGWADENPSKVAGFVIQNSWAFVKEPPMKLPLLYRFLTLGKGGWRRTTDKNFFTEVLLQRFGTTRTLTNAEIDAYRGAHPTPQDRYGVGRFPQLIAQTGDKRHESWATMDALEDGLRKLVDKPALIVWAMKDPAFRTPFLERWQRLFKDVDGPHLLPTGKHFFQEDHSDDVVDEIESWAEKKFPRAAVKVTKKVEKATA